MDTAAIIDGLTHYKRLPVSAIAAAREARGGLVSEFLRLIENHPDEHGETDGEHPSLFLIFHLLGEWRATSAYRPLANLLRRGDVDDVLGYAITETAHSVMAAVFDGDPQPLYDVILDESADPFVRAVMFDTLVTVVGEGQLSRAEVARFLADCFTEMRPVECCYVWCGWQDAVTLLRLEELRPLVKQVFDRGSIDATWLSYQEFEEDLAYAVAHPEAPREYAQNRYRLFGDTVEVLSKWYGFSEAYFAKERRFVSESAKEQQLAYAIEDPTSPFINPSRNVGRNDPCPCGSGKKYKKCCLN
jgi:Protein of unknown function (DUF1186)/SEC-C motif